MITLLLLFALNVATPGEMECTGSVREMAVPMDLYIAGIEQEGPMTLASSHQRLHLNGPNISALTAGSLQRVVRPEGKIRDMRAGSSTGLYYLDIGTIRIEGVDKNHATARIVHSCQEMVKGDLVIPYAEKPMVQFDGILSKDSTPMPQDGLVGSITFGKADAKQLAAGNFCFVNLGRSDGVRAGDRFMVFRPSPAFDFKDLSVLTPGPDGSYGTMRGPAYQFKLKSLLGNRTLPPIILGDIVIVEAGETFSSGKIIHSLSEIRPGDFIVKR